MNATGQMCTDWGPARSAGRAALLIAALAAVMSPAAAQVEGVTLGVTPTVEYIYWHDDLRLDESWYYGGRVSLGFGRFVALQGYYLEGDDVELDGMGELETARRYGGDIVFTFANRGLTPFLRAGAGISEFGGGGFGDEEEVLTATGAAGIRLNLFERLETQVFAQDILFQLPSTSPLVQPGRIPAGETETFHNLAIGAGVNFKLGGERRQSATDRAFEGGIRGIASPLEIYGGEVRWDEAAAVEDLEVGGVRLGMDFGPYVGLRGYYFGSIEEDFDDFFDYFGYGAEGRFNLTRSSTAFTPFLVLGGGRIHFPGAVATAAGFDDDKKWNAVLGGGVALRLSDRLSLQGSARDVVLTIAEPESTTDPSELYHNWMYTGGLRYAFGGLLGEPEPRDPVAAAVIPAGDPDRRDPARAVESPAAYGADDQDALVREIRALRMEVDSLRREIRARDPRPEPSIERAGAVAVDTASTVSRADTATAPVVRAPGAASTIELPVLEHGVIYIRFGQGGIAETATAAVQAPNALTDRDLESLAQLLATERARLAAAADEVEPAAGDSVLELLDALQAQVDAMAAARRVAPTPAAVAEPRPAELDRLERLEERMAERLASLEDELRALQRVRATEAPEPQRVRVEVAGEPDFATVTAPRRPRGVLRGDAVGVHRLSPEVGAGLDDPEQFLLGLKADIGSAFGGSVRVVPELLVGVSDDFTWNANGHLEWPVPVRVSGVRPWLGAGLGVLHDGELELLIPNLLVGLSYPVRSYELFGTLEGLDWFDNTRLVFGVHTRAPSFMRPDDVTVVAVPVPARPATPVAEDVGVVEDTAAAAATAGVAEAAPPARDTMPAAEPAAPAEPVGPVVPPEEALRRQLSDLVGAPAIADVRRTDRGVAVVIGGSGSFATGRADLSADARASLRRVADLLVQRDVGITVEGHTDDRGADAANQALSRNRAESVRDALLAFGIDAGRITVAAYGESRPIASNATAEGRTQNRRVEVVLTPNP